MKKVCPGCGEERDIEKDFSWKNIAKGTRQRWCRFCQAEANKKHYQNNRQTYIDHAREYHQNNRVENRQRLYEYLSAYPCVDCGCEDIRVLEFDHIRGSKKKSISRLLSTDASWEIIQTEIDKCEVRCANCHRIKTNEQRGLWRGLFAKLDGGSTYTKSRLLLYEYLSTHPCVDCGCDDTRVLEFDHVRDSKKADVAVMIRNGCSWSAIQAEIAKCEIRCANCHRIKTLEDRDSWRSLLDG